VRCIILGAFGGITFLIADLISSNEEKSGEKLYPIITYVFKPVFGMFLACAFFIADITALSVISKSGTYSPNIEFLYFLALAAGLLSDVAYKQLLIRAQRAINDAPPDPNKTPPKAAPKSAPLGDATEGKI
jgi:hypothetical protein